MKKRYQFSEKLISTIVINASGFLSSNALDKLITDFEKQASLHSFSKSSETNLLRIINSIFDKGSFFIECSRYPHFIEMFTAISSYSNYLTDILVRNPELIYLTLKENFFKNKISREELHTQISKGKKQHPHINSFAEYLKFIQRKYILKIGLRDILNFANLKEITEDISTLAYEITSALFDATLAHTFEKNKLSFLPNKHTVIALGKMGGYELNYSSDIDLIIFFDKNNKLQNGKEYFEILNEAIQIFTKLTSEITNGGFLYRVDFRLRPDGKFSPLARTLNDTITYYETRGELWEKQMLIKSSFMNGSLELYEKFAHFRKLYSYGSSFTSSPLKKIREMKYEIERHYKNSANVKTFWGGIRDIEFSVQALQLVNGYKFPELQTPNTLDALQHLNSKGILTEEEFAIFSDSYIFFRRIEHFLQLLNNFQTHIIPDDNEVLLKLATFLNLKSIGEFDKELTRRRTAVRSIFYSIFKIKTNEQIFSFDKINFYDKKRAEKNIEYLRVGCGLLGNKSFDAKTIKLFGKIEPTLTNYLLDSSDSDKVLENFVKLTSATSFQSILYSEFTNLSFFKKILTICEYSQIAIDLLNFDKSLIDFLLSRKAFIDISKTDITNFTYSQFRFVLALQYALNLIDENLTSQLLTNYFTIRLKHVLEGAKIKYDFFVAGLGSFGIKEMNFFSDIDLIVVVEKITNRKKMETDFQDFLQYARNIFPNVEIDFRLRPEGKSSLLVWDVENYQTYLSNRADYWEFQTLMKINFVAGNKNLFSSFKNIILNSFQKRSQQFSVTELKVMHDKSTQIARSITPSFDLKKNIGGFLTIDYLLQAFLHQNFNLAQSIIGKTQSEKFTILLGEFADRKKELSEIKTNYNKLKTILFKMQNYYNSAGYKIILRKNEMDGFVNLLGYDNFNNLQQEIIKIAKSNYIIFVEMTKNK